MNNIYVQLPIAEPRPRRCRRKWSPPNWSVYPAIDPVDLSCRPYSPTENKARILVPHMYLSSPTVPERNTLYSGTRENSRRQQVAVNYSEPRMNRAFILRRSESLLRMKPTGFRQQSYGQRKVKGKVKKPFKLNLADDTNATYE